MDDIYIHRTLASSSSFTDPTYYSGDYGNAMIQLSFRVQCDHNFYGRNCSTFCVHTDNSTGHYACGANGERVCLNGWRNPSENCLTRKCILISKLSLTYDIWLLKILLKYLFSLSMMVFCIAVCIGGCHAIGGYCNNSGHCRWVLNEHSGTACYSQWDLQKTQLWHCRNDMPRGPERLLFLFQNLLL